MDVDEDEAEVASKADEDVAAVVAMVTEDLLTRTVAHLLASAQNSLAPGVAAEVVSDVEAPVAAAKVAVVDVVGIRPTQMG